MLEGMQFHRKRAGKQDNAYWRKCLRYAIDGNLQAVLDETWHLHWDQNAWAGELDSASARLSVAGKCARALADSRSLRQAALLHKIPYYTTLSGARAAALGIEALLAGQFQVRPLQSYFTAA